MTDSLIKSYGLDTKMDKMVRDLTLES